MHKELIRKYGAVTAIVLIILALLGLVLNLNGPNPSAAFVQPQTGISFGAQSLWFGFAAIFIVLALILLFWWAETKKVKFW